MLIKTDKFNKCRRDFMKTSSLIGAALMLGLNKRIAHAELINPKMNKRYEIPSWYKPGDLRDYIKLLDEKGELIKIKKEVNPKYEIGALLWHYEELGKAVMFENIKGSNIPAIGGLFQNWRRIGLSLGISGKFGPSEMYKQFISAMSKPKQPQETNSIPWKEVIYKDKIDISKLPIPTLFEGDGGPYITGGVGICKNPETNTYNLGVYRMQVIDKDKILVWAFPGSDLHYIYRTYERMGKEMDFAVIIGADPAIFFTAVSKVPPEIDEIGVAGALTNEEIKVGKCETIDLFVPINGEIVIEGKINPKVRRIDGPFADHGGIYKGGPSPVLCISAISHRKNPIFHVILSGDSMEHCTTSEILGCFWAHNILDHLKSKFDNVKDVNLFWRGGTKKWVAVSLTERRSDKEPQEIIKEIFNLSTQRYRMQPVSSFLRAAILVNEDVDIYNVREVVWAIGTRLQNCIIIEEDKQKGYELRIGLDATLPKGIPVEKYKKARTKLIDEYLFK